MPARNLGFGQGDVGWAHRPLSIFKRDTVDTLAREHGHTVLRGEADGSASMYLMSFDPAVAVPAAPQWRWKTAALVPGADNRSKSVEDAPLRVMLGFDGDLSALPFSERGLRLADLPYATLMYVWSDHVPVETLIPSAHTSRVKMLVVASGARGLGHWHTVRRNVAAGEYADIRCGCPPGLNLSP